MYNRTQPVTPKKFFIKYDEDTDTSKVVDKLDNKYYNGTWEQCDKWILETW